MVDHVDSRCELKPVASPQGRVGQLELAPNLRSDTLGALADPGGGGGQPGHAPKAQEGGKRRPLRFPTTLKLKTVPQDANAAPEFPNHNRAPSNTERRPLNMKNAAL